MSSKKAIVYSESGQNWKTAYLDRSGSQEPHAKCKYCGEGIWFAKVFFKTTNKDAWICYSHRGHGSKDLWILEKHECKK